MNAYRLIPLLISLSMLSCAQPQKNTVRYQLKMEDLKYVYGPFPPVAIGHSNAFNTQDIRIRRRGVSYSELNAVTGKVDYGLHFICFQNNIQQTGFEFINNIWLMNPDFRLSKDGLFDLHAGIIEPVDGCYYFIPPEYRDFPGEVFFE